MWYWSTKVRGLILEFDFLPIFDLDTTLSEVSVKLKEDTAKL